MTTMTTTVESGFGSYHMARGFMLNNQLTDFSAQPADASGLPIANRVQAGKRPRSSMSPTLVFRKAADGSRGEFMMATGSPGGLAAAQPATSVVFPQPGPALTRVARRWVPCASRSRSRGRSTRPVGSTGIASLAASRSDSERSATTGATVGGRTRIRSPLRVAVTTPAGALRVGRGNATSRGFACSRARRPRGTARDPGSTRLPAPDEDASGEGMTRSRRNDPILGVAQ